MNSTAKRAAFEFLSYIGGMHNSQIYADYLKSLIGNEKLDQCFSKKDLTKFHYVGFTEDLLSNSNIVVDAFNGEN